MSVSNERPRVQTYFDLVEQRETATLPANPHVQMVYRLLEDIPPEELAPIIQKLANDTALQIIIKRSGETTNAFCKHPPGEAYPGCSKSEFCKQGLTATQVERCKDIRDVLKAEKLTEIWAMMWGPVVRVADRAVMNQILTRVEKAVAPLEERERRYADYRDPDDALLI